MVMMGRHVGFGMAEAADAGNLAAIVRMRLAGESDFANLEWQLGSFEPALPSI
jgi:hypothetical protein